MANTQTISVEVVPSVVKPGLWNVIVGGMVAAHDQPKSEATKIAKDIKEGLA